MQENNVLVILLKRFRTATVFANHVTGTRLQGRVQKRRNGKAVDQSVYLSRFSVRFHLYCLFAHKQNNASETNNCYRLTVLLGTGRK